VIDLHRDGDLLILDLGEGDHRFSPDTVARIDRLLDQVEQSPEPRALVTRATGKIWHNGLDLDWLGTHPDRMDEVLGSVQRLLARVLVLPVPTVAAVQGHAFGAGAMLALAHDSRLMRADRGYFCLPEIDIRLPFTSGMATLIQSRLSRAVAHEAMTTGRRYGGEEAAGLSIAEGAFPADELGPAALELARSRAGKDATTLGAIKQLADRRAYQALTV
jgi:enoyl-CoA hydratase/carnithine racemase